MNRIMKHRDPFKTGKIILMIAFAVSVTIILMSCDKQETEKAEIGKEAPHFSLKDLEGNTVRLSDYAGKVVVLDFWATWCHACKEAAPALESIYQKYKNADFIILGITLDSGFGAEENVKTFVLKQNQTYPILWDDKTTSKAYGIIRIPTTYILDRDHIITDRLIGFLPEFEKKMDIQISKQLNKTRLDG